MIEKQSITDIIPQRAPFVMVDSILSVAPDRFVSTLFVDPENTLVSQGLFTESGMLENVAQTSAAGFGTLTGEEGEAPRRGYIGSITRVEVYSLPEVGSQIRTVVTPTHRLDNIVMVSGRCYLDEILLLECEMKIVLA
ncbi:hypothetical protein [Dyadobacter tibetensis]|uniref:hypothetical protein n=1 Tax=Dyadobacter tibetensis TaxID=1211851 RepID=UPI0004704C46|nr:hypothetical protein [Dyadobacter tibetensis]